MGKIKQASINYTPEELADIDSLPEEDRQGERIARAVWNFDYDGLLQTRKLLLGVQNGNKVYVDLNKVNWIQISVFTNGNASIEFYLNTGKALELQKNGAEEAYAFLSQLIFHIGMKQDSFGFVHLGMEEYLDGEFMTFVNARNVKWYIFDLDNDIQLNMVFKDGQELNLEGYDDGFQERVADQLSREEVMRFIPLKQERRKAQRVVASLTDCK